MENKTTPDFSVGSVIGQAWHLISGVKWAIWAPMVLFIISIFAASMVLGALLIYSGMNLKNPPYLYQAILAPIIMCFVTAPFYGSFYMVAISKARGDTVRGTTGFSFFKRYLAVTITFLILTVFANIFSTIFNTPAIAAQLGKARPFLDLAASIYSLFFYAFTILSLPLVIDKKLSPIAAITTSFHVVKHHWGKVILSLLSILLFTIITILPGLLGIILRHDVIVLLGFAISLVAAIWLVPFTMLIQGVLYRLLIDKKEPVIGPEI